MERLLIHFAYIAIAVLNLSRSVHQDTTSSTQYLPTSKNAVLQNVNENQQVNKSIIYYDYQTHVKAYKNLKEARCYIERLQPHRRYQTRSDQSQPESIHFQRIQTPDVKLTHRTINALAGPRVVVFCRGYPTYFLQYVPVSNISGYQGFENVEKESNHFRHTRQTQHYFVGRSHGQTQSQYMQFGNGNSPGKAEAEASYGSSKAVVTGSSGMGQAQSQSSPYGCDGCYNQDQGFQFNRSPGGEIREPIGPPGYTPGYRPGGTYVIPPGYKPGGQITQPGGGGITPEHGSGQPGGYRPGAQVPGGEGGIPPGYRPGGQGTHPGDEGGFPPGYRPDGQVTQPGGEGGTPPGYRPGGKKPQPGGESGYTPGVQPGGGIGIPPGYRPGTPRGDIGAPPGYRPGGQVIQPGFPGEYRPGTQVAPPAGGGAIPPGYRPGGQGTPPTGESIYTPGEQVIQPGGEGGIQPGGEGGIPPIYRPGTHVVQPGSEGGEPPGYRPGEQTVQPGGGYPDGHRPGTQVSPPSGEVGTPPGYRPGVEEGRYPPGYKPGGQVTQPGGGIPPGYRPGGQVTQPGGNGHTPGGQGNIPPPYRPGGQVVQPGGDGSIPPGYKPGTQTTQPGIVTPPGYRPGGQVTYPGSEGGFPPGYRPNGQVTKPGVEAGTPPGYRPGEQVTQPGGETTFTPGYKPGRQPGSEISPENRPGGQIAYPGEHVTYPGKTPPAYRPGDETYKPGGQIPTGNEQWPSNYGPGYFGGKFYGDYHASANQGKFSGTFAGQYDRQNGYKPNGYNPDYNTGNGQSKGQYPENGQFSGKFSGDYGHGNPPDFQKPGSWGGQTSGDSNNNGGPQNIHNGKQQPNQTPGYGTNDGHPQPTGTSIGPHGMSHTNTGEPGFGNTGGQSTTQPGFGDTEQPGPHTSKFNNSVKPTYGGQHPDGGNDAAGSVVPGTWPADIQQEDDAYSQVQTSVQQLNNETQASANAQGRYLGGDAHSQVSGTYSGSGSFSAAAGSNDGKRGALTQVSGGKKGVVSSAQGSGGRSQSQAQVQYSSDTSDTAANAQTNGFNHGTNTQVQGGGKGGMANAQANGPGSTSSQAQIGFVPQEDHQVVISPRRGATANAQGGSHSGQSQVQVQGQFLQGIKYTGSAQAGSGRKLVPRNQSQFETLSYSFPSYKPLTFNSPPSPAKEIQGQENLNSTGDSGKIQQKLQQQQSRLEVTTILPTNEQESNTEEYDDYESEETTGTDNKKPIIRQATRSQKQHIVLDPLEDVDTYVTQVQGDPELHDGMILQPGQTIPGSYGHQVPQGFRGVVKAVSSIPHTSATGQNSQAQTVSLVPGHGKIIYRQPAYAVSSRTGNKNGYYSYGSGYTYQPAVQSRLRAGVNNPSFVSSSTSETGYQNPKTGKRIPSVYYSQSSTCGYFTNKCIINGRNRICFPKSNRNPDGSPIVC